MKTPIPVQPVRRHRFPRRFARALGVAGALLGVSLFLGVLGYHFLAGFAWIDALLNAAMILTGMGPVGALTSDLAKIFASLYALFSALVFLTATAIVMSPMVRRVLHRFHVEEKGLE